MSKFGVILLYFCLGLPLFTCKNFGFDNVYTCNCEYDSVCDQITGQCPGNCKRGWSGPSCQRENVALDQPASQISFRANGRATLAVDGNRANVVNDENTDQLCTDTDNQYNPWWRVDLQQTYPIRDINIVYRNPHLDKFVGFTITTDRGECYKHYGYASSLSYNLTAQCSTTTNGRSVTITVPGNVFLVLCEVEIYVCSKGTHGNDCSNFCHCANNARCVSANCPATAGNRYKCQPGWYGNSCNLACSRSARSYGLNCASSCSNRHCQGSQDCNHVTGKCIDGCRPGYTGDDCRQRCSNSYGIDCALWCSNRQCKGRTNCNHTTGRCIDGCRSGYSGDDCTQTCSGSYGPGCTSDCNSRQCKGRDDCNRVTGKCIDGCHPGYTRDDCTHICPSGKYGQNCQSDCSAHCKTSQDCNHVNGNCNVGCKAGYQGDTCTKICTFGSYGQDCQYDCSENCKTSQDCNHVTGTCNGGCKSGYQRDTCTQKCFKSYGPNCASTCSDRNCMGNDDCNHVTGKCIDGCNPGYQGDVCTQKCFKSYGLNCASKCSNRNCMGNDDCNHVTGKCTGGCHPGYQGDDCTQMCVESYGPDNCALKCSDRNCMGNDDCNHVTGKCTDGCTSQYSGNDCTRVCNNGYGKYCEFNCGERKCNGNQDCDRTTGRCIGGCKAGYIGDDCTQACKGRYGPNCGLDCNSRQCNGRQDCNQETGKCIDGCLPGYTGDDCTKKCSNSYGQDCVFQCKDRYCNGSKECDHLTGRCIDGCDDGFAGDDCIKSMKFGFKRFYNCHCKNGEYCNTINGQCPGVCDSGWSGLSCQRQNVALDKPASQIQIKNNKPALLAVDGNRSNSGLKCIDTGNIKNPWWRVDLEQTYPIRDINIDINIVYNDGYLDKFVGFIINIDTEVGQKTTCYQHTGDESSLSFDYDVTCNNTINGRYVTITNSRYTYLDLCEVEVYVCSYGTYGDGCNDFCHCTGNVRCDYLTGSCPDNSCQAGWTGNSCNQVCNRSYGQDCSKDCDDRNCHGIKDCNHVTGSCIEGCRPGYQRDDCTQIKIVTVNTVLIASTVSVFGIVIIIILIVIVIKKRRPFLLRKLKKNKKPKMAAVNPTVRPGNAPIYENSAAIQRSLEASDIALREEVGKSENGQIELKDNVYYNLSNIEFPTVTRSKFNYTELQDFIESTKLENGFELLFKSLATEYSSTFDASQLSENKTKNRYKGYYPYDNTRVILSIQDGNPHTDFINANYLHGYNLPKAYIAAQGPTDITIDDFIRMIWEQKCEKVIMVTKEYEMTKMKCKRYWPEKETETFGQFKLTLIKEKIRANFTIRIVSMQKDNIKHQFYHFNYTSWPDHGVPDIHDLLDFLFTVNKVNPKSTAPQLVHCSAGIGRTGTYAAIDICLKQWKATGHVKVMPCITKMRDERKGMIQTEHQLQFVFEALLEGIIRGDTSLNKNEFEANYDEHGYDLKMGKMSPREHFQFLKTIETDTANITKVYSEEKSLYSFPSYTNSRGYFFESLIGLDVDTMWKMIHDRRSTIAVFITDNNNMNQTGLYPGSGSKEEYNDITVETISQENLSDKITRMSVRVTKQELNTDLVVFILNIQKSQVKKFLYLSQHVLELLQHVSVDKRNDDSITIFSSNLQYVRVFCIMRNVLQRIMLDNEVEIVQNVLKMHQRIEQTIYTEEEFKVLFEVISEYIKSTGMYANM